MTFKMAALVTLGLLVVPATGVLVTLAIGDEPKATAEPSKPPAPKPVRAEKKAKAEPVEKPLAPPDKTKTKTKAKTKAKPKNVVTIAGTKAIGTDLSGSLSWTADDMGAKIENPCAYAACLGPDEQEKACAKGTVIRAKKTTPKKSWGAGINWNLREDDKGVHALGKTTSKGLSFHLDAKGKGVNYLFGVTVKGEDYCVEMKPGNNRIKWTSLRKGCTEKSVEGKRDLGDLLSSVTQVYFRAQATKSKEQKFDFCVSDIKVL